MAPTPGVAVPGIPGRPLAIGCDRVARIREHHVGAGAAAIRVGLPVGAAQHVGVRAAIEQIASRSAVEQVVAGSTAQGVVAAALR